MTSEWSTEGGLATGSATGTPEDAFLAWGWEGSWTTTTPRLDGHHAQTTSFISMLVVQYVYLEVFL